LSLKYLTERKGPLLDNKILDGVVNF